jgi:hypothetical protein
VASRSRRARPPFYSSASRCHTIAPTSSCGYSSRPTTRTVSRKTSRCSTPSSTRWPNCGTQRRQGRLTCPRPRAAFPARRGHVQHPRRRMVPHQGNLLLARRVETYGRVGHCANDGHLYVPFSSTLYGALDLFERGLLVQKPTTCNLGKLCIVYTYCGKKCVRYCFNHPILRLESFSL